MATLTPNTGTDWLSGYAPASGQVRRAWAADELARPSDASGPRGDRRLPTRAFR
ncbi:hypothetical protein ACIOEW_23755 [Streptomyces sp. NPDC087901]|uniref:hypothetical protein n=1 Tax=unclassified Streptomyces TaxID=2593676 RepID=UPI003425200C